MTHDFVRLTMFIFASTLSSQILVLSIFSQISILESSIFIVLFFAVQASVYFATFQHEKLISKELFVKHYFHNIFLKRN